MNFQHNPTNQISFQIFQLRPQDPATNHPVCIIVFTLRLQFHKNFIWKNKIFTFCIQTHINSHNKWKKKEKFNIPDLGGIRLYLCQVALQGNQTICLSFLLTHTWWQFSWLLSEYKEWYDNQWAIMWMIKANPNF